MNNFFRLNIRLTIHSPDGNDVVMECNKTLPFQPVEGLVLRIPLADETTEGYDPEFEVTLGPPTYSYLESAFVEDQAEDEAVVCQMREGISLYDAARDVIKFYEAYGFKRVRV